MTAIFNLKIFKPKVTYSSSFCVFFDHRMNCKCFLNPIVYSGAHGSFGIPYRIPKRLCAPETVTSNDIHLWFNLGYLFLVFILGYYFRCIL